ncbi:MAG: ATP-dependent DNA helicase RecG [bacterium]
MHISLTTPIHAIGPIGKAITSRLKKLDLKTAEDLLWHFPFRYDDYSQLKNIGQLVGGEVVTIKGKIELINNKRSKVKRTIVTEAMIADATGSIKAVWFNQPFLIKNLKAGDEIYLSGKVDFDYYGLQFNSPEYEKVRYSETITTARLAPVYSLTSNVTQKQIRFLIKQILKLTEEVEDWLPDKMKDNLNLINISDALCQIHFPKDKQSLELARKRLKFDEHFFIQLQSQFIKLEIEQNKAQAIKFKEKETKDFVGSLLFILTNDQKKAAWEILQDLEKDKPMNRLLEGNVGSGKTVVAAMALLSVFLNKRQAVFMAPTEILASQHFKSISELFKNNNIRICLLTRNNFLANNVEPSPNLSAEGGRDVKIPPAPLCERGEIEKLTKAKLIKMIGNGEVDIIIGTHAIIQEKVNFKNLALAIIDEQHRFGVEQRHALNKKDGLKKTMPHFLSMTATPIPRSLSLALYGDLDLSTIKEMPKDRKAVITKVVSAQNREKAYQFISDKVKQGRQIFVVCPLIDPSDKLGYKSVSSEYEKLNKKIFPKFKIGLLHGRLKKEEKEKVMQNFLDNKINILVSTSVIEVGIDIPNATIMMIEGAERFGLAQLHQFRGRVGRSNRQSYCLLFTELSGQKIQERLNCLASCNDGFELAEQDLKLRGPGEICGIRQSGMPKFKIASFSDVEIIKLAKNEAQGIIIEIDKHPLLKNKLEEYNRGVHLE